MCKDPKQCASHECTRKEIDELKEQNQQFRKELEELKDVIHNLHDLESIIKEIYSSHRHPIIHSIKKFFEGGKKRMKVFLGGTCNESTWRDELIKYLKIDYFNPVVPDWTEECYQRELKERETCDICLYCITPRMTGVYSIAEVIDDSNKRPMKTVFVFLPVDGDKRFDDGQIKSLKKVGQMVERNGGKWLQDFKIESIASALNYHGV